MLAAAAALLAGAACTRAAIVQVGAGDSNVKYLPDVIDGKPCVGHQENVACERHWWVEDDVTQNGNTYHETFGPGTSLSYTFLGTSFGVFAAPGAPGAFGNVTLDGVVTSVNFTALADGSRVFFQDGLNASASHHFLLQYDDEKSFGGPGNRHYLGVDYFEVDVPDGSSPQQPVSTPSSPAPGSSQQSSIPTNLPAPAASAPNSGAASSSSSSSASSPPTGGIIAGSVVGGLALGAGAVLAFLRFRRRPRVPPPLKPMQYELPPIRPVPQAPYPFALGRGEDGQRYSVTYPSTHSDDDPPIPVVRRPPPPPERRTRLLVQNPDARSARSAPSTTGG